MAEASNQSVTDNLNTKNGNFICGVVEGFYGRPWTTEQRKDLFQKMKKWGMDSYVYAPKDDYKHRAYWRELYTVEEAEHLTGLITAARDQNITFFYALSPGLDITYSSAKEITALKRKLEQVSQFGCTAFALLFDDIEPEMSEADKEIFQSFAHAQVSVTNEIFQHLGQPRFLLCPTQYCSTRAMPNVTNSEYLNTLGSKLAQEIDIMWTGPKVISRQLTMECIQEITDVLKRPPVIWDNLHANDYDQKRVFLGPYSGRSPDLIPKLRGVLTNPNCEYGANFIAIHTLAQWSRCNVDGKRDLSLNDTVSADIKLETETEDGLSGEDVPKTLSPNMYHPRQALRNAISEWLPEFSKHKAAWGPIAKPQPVVAAAVPVPIIPSINTCMSITTTTTSCVATASTTPLAVVSTNQLQALAEVCSSVTVNDSFINPVPGPVMNSLVSDTKVICNESIPNPITPIPIPVVPADDPDPTSTKAITILNGQHIRKKLENRTTNDDGIGDNNTGGGSNGANNGISNMCKQIIDDVPMNTETTSNDDVIDDTSNGTTITVTTTATTTTTGNGSGGASGNCNAINSHSTGTITTATVAAGGVATIGTNLHTDFSPLSSMSSMEPMDCNSTPNASPAHVTKSLSSNEDVAMSENTSTSSASMQVETVAEDPHVSMAVETDTKAENQLTYEDLALLCDLFYLPFEHGGQGLQLLQEFNWLKSNAHLVISANQNKNNPIKPEVQEWFDRAAKMNEMCTSVNRLFQHLTYCNNRELLYDLYSYVWDIRGVISLLNSYIKWLGFSKGWKETFMSGDQEPWVFRGGLTADLQRLIPVDSGNDLFIYKAPDVPTSKTCTIRPFLPEDEYHVYAICTRTCRDGLEDTNLIPEEFKDLYADRFVGQFITLHPELCMVVEDETGEIVGYCCAVLDSKKFRVKQEISWIPEMINKYPDQESNKTLPKFAQECISYFHNFKDEPQFHSVQHQSIMCCSLLPSILDQSVSKRLVTCILAALRASGSFGVHVYMNSNDNYTRTFYSKLGFVENNNQETIKDKIIMTRTF